MKKYHLLIFLLAILHLGAGTGYAMQNQIVAGAGPSTKVAELFFSSFGKDPACQDYKFMILEKSVKHKGGIQSSDKFLFGRTGRPLTSAEKALGKEEILLGQVPIIFAVGLETQTKRITLQQLELIFSRKITNWKQLGGGDAPILLVGREATEALFRELKKDYSFFQKVKFDKTFNKDYEIVSFLKSKEGARAISFGAKPNFPAFNILEVTGLSANSPIGLVYDVKNQQHPLIKAAIAYARSPQWTDQLTLLDLRPLN